MKKLIFLFFIFLFSNVICTGEIKDWVGKSWNDGQKLYFSGMSELSESLKKAKELAYSDAVLNAAKYLGIKVSNQTNSEIKNNNVMLLDQTSTLLEDTFISYATIKDFSFEEKGNKYIAYILLEINKDTLAKEQNRKDSLEQQKIEVIKKQNMLIDENKRSGEYKLIVSNKLNTIKFDIQNIFESFGYIITNQNDDKNISTISVNVVDEQVNNVVDDMFSYEIKVSVKFNNKSFLLKSKKISEDDISMAKQLVFKNILKQLQENLKK